MLQKSKKQIIEINTLKNNKKTKNNIKVRYNCTYQHLLAKISKNYTNKQFTLQLRSQDGLSYKILTKQLWNHILGKIRGEYINIVTIDLNSSHQSSLIRQGSNNSLSYQQSIFNNQQIINQTFQQIRPYLQKLSYQKIIDKLDKKNLPKLYSSQNCSQCSEVISQIYYKCLICKEFYLCGKCEQKESESQLINHKFRAHPFAKIRPQTQIGEDIKITTLKAEQIKFDDDQNYPQQEQNKQIEAQQGLINILLKKLITTKLQQTILINQK